MLYHDTYFGKTNFMGEEVVYNNSDAPIWGMNYYGITLDKSLSEETIDKALRPALMLVESDNTIGDQKNLLMANINILLK